MKWTIVALAGVGLLAAICAAVLVASASASNEVRAPVITAPVVETATFVVAARDLETLTILGEDDVETRSVAAESAPPGAARDASALIGRALEVPVRKGQALSETLLAPDGSAAYLAASLSAGSRAVSVTTSGLGIEPLLVPGCLVDVLATMDGPEGGSVAVTLLEGVRVLAIRGAAGEPGRRAGPTNVTLLVDPDQAERLELAGHEGRVSLALRNPNDVARRDAAGTQLAELSPLLAAREAPTRIETPAPPTTAPEPATHQTLILRGGVAERRVFELAADENP